MTGNPVVWFEIYVQDMTRARAFYESVFQLTLQPLESPGLEMLAFPMDMETVGAGGALVHMPDVASGGNSTLVYFNSQDCSTEEARIAPAGGRVHRPKMSIGEYGFVTLAFDSEGNMFGLHSLE